MEQVLVAGTGTGVAWDSERDTLSARPVTDGVTRPQPTHGAATQRKLPPTVFTDGIDIHRIPDPHSEMIMIFPLFMFCPHSVWKEADDVDVLRKKKLTEWILKR